MSGACMLARRPLGLTHALIGVCGGKCRSECMMLMPACTGSNMGSLDVWWWSVPPFLPFFWFSKQMVMASAVWKEGCVQSSRVCPFHSCKSCSRSGTVLWLGGTGVYSPTRRRKKKPRVMRSATRSLLCCPLPRWVFTVWRTTELGSACCGLGAGSLRLAAARKVVTARSRLCCSGAVFRGSRKPRCSRMRAMC